MRKLAVIGLGHVGATVAYTLVTKGIADELILIDKNEDKVIAEQYDLLDMLARIDTSTKIKIQDYDSLKDADVIITTFGNIAALSEGGNRFGEYDHNVAQVKEVGQKIKASGFNGVIVNVTNPCDVITTLLVRYTGLPTNQVFGTGTFLDTARMQRIVGEKLGQDPRNVEGWVLGEHGSSQFIAWSTVRVNNKIAIQLFSENEQKKLSKQPNKNSFVVANGKGYTSYAIATCATRLIQAVFSDSRLFAPVSVYNPEYKTYIGYPAIIGRDGIEQVVELKLTSSEREKLQAAADKIKEHLNQLKNK